MICSFDTWCAHGLAELGLSECQASRSFMQVITYAHTPHTSKLSLVHPEQLRRSLPSFYPGDRSRFMAHSRISSESEVSVPCTSAYAVCFPSPSSISTRRDGSNVGSCWSAVATAGVARHHGNEGGMTPLHHLLQPVLSASHVDELTSSHIFHSTLPPILS